MVRVDAQQGGVFFGDGKDKQVSQQPENNDKGKISIFIPGNSRTKENGALIPDKVEVYQDGKLVKTTTGFDENGDGVLEGTEIQTEFFHNSNNKENGAIPYDVMKEYNNGELETIREGYDYNNNGVFDPGEQVNVFHPKNDDN